jgi:O-acetylserine/cysteine efflux transporter
MLIRPLHIALCLMIVVAWGMNFIFIKFALEDISALLLCTLRYGLSAIPAVFFFRRPRTPFHLLVAYGLCMFGIQYLFLFSAMKSGAPAGISSLIFQIQIFFTLGLSVLFFKVRPGVFELIGATVAFSGIGLVALHTTGEITWIQILLLLGGALSWSLGNILSQKIHPENPVALVVWGNLFAFPCLLFLTFFIEGSDFVFQSLSGMKNLTVISITYIVGVSTLFGFSAWSWMIREYKAPAIVPFTLLVPVVGFIGSYLFFGEMFPVWKVISSTLVILGILLNLFGKRLSRSVFKF